MCFCSLCNTKATSEQTLLLHAEGKKHRARARAIHVAKQQPKQPEESALDTKPTPENKQIEEPKLQDASRVNAEQNSSEAGNGTLLSEKKRKLDASKNDESRKKTRDNTSDEVIQSGKTEANGKESQLEIDKLVESSSAKNESSMKIKWKKLITSTLKLVCILNNIISCFPVKLSNELCHFRRGKRKEKESNTHPLSL